MPLRRTQLLETGRGDVELRRLERRALLSPEDMAAYRRQARRAGRVDQHPLTHMATEWQHRLARLEAKARSAAQHESPKKRARAKKFWTSVALFEKHGLGQLLSAAREHYPDIDSHDPHRRVAAKMALARHIVPGIASSAQRHLEHVSKVVESRFVPHGQSSQEHEPHGVIQALWSGPHPELRRARAEQLADVIRHHYPHLPVSVRTVPPQGTAHHALTSLPWEQDVVDVGKPLIH